MATRPIEHVILLILENRSFDQMFGYRNDYPEPFKVDGIVNCNEKDEKKRAFNLDKDDKPVYLNRMKAFSGHDDNTHDLAATLFCINGPEGKKDCSGYVKANQLRIKDEDNHDETHPIPGQEIMSYFSHGCFPVYDYIADNFTICDKWFAALPSCTQPNKVFGMAAQSAGHIDNLGKKGLFGETDSRDKLTYDCDTIFDRLNAKKLKWKVYYSDLPASLFLQHQTTPENMKNYSKMSNFVNDVSAGEVGAFTFIEPEYGVESNEAKLQGATYGQGLVKHVIETLQSNDTVWKKSLFMIYYDESGGFYDHVYPPAAIPPFKPNPNEPKPFYTFDQYGPRVPAMIVSPWIPKGVSHTIFDHTSLLKFVVDNFKLDHLTDRDLHANSIGELILSSPREDFIGVKDVSIHDESAGSEATYRNTPGLNQQFFQNLVGSYFADLVIMQASVIADVNADLHATVNLFHDLHNCFLSKDEKVKDKNVKEMKGDKQEVKNIVIPPQQQEKSKFSDVIVTKKEEVVVKSNESACCSIM